MRLILLIHIAATWGLVGLIWTIQVVHYPLFAQVGSSTYPAYHVAHMSRITLIVLPFMAVEALTALFLALNPPNNIPASVFWLGLALVILIWGSTGLVNVPQHTALASGFNIDTHRALVLTNWIRTVAWSLRGLLMLWVLFQLLPE